MWQHSRLEYTSLSHIISPAPEISPAVLSIFPSWFCLIGGIGDTGDIFLISTVAVLTLLFLSLVVVVVLLIITSIPKPSSRLERIWLSLLLSTLGDFDHSLLSVEILCSCANTSNTSSISSGEPLSDWISPYMTAGNAAPPPPIEAANLYQLLKN